MKDSMAAQHMKEELRMNYERRIHRVMDYINTHLDEEISLDTLAAQASFSPFHFHRLFTALTGEPVAAYIRRLRLERAAWYLIVGPKRSSITEVALDSGFASSAVFARAFRERFGMSASEWRNKHRKNSKDMRKDTQTMGKQEQESQGTPLYALPYWVPQRRLTDKEKTVEVHIVKMPAMRAAYVRRLGPYGESACQAWETLFRWAGPRNLLGTEHMLFGISYDDPLVTPPEKLRYDACIVIDGETEVDSQVGVLELTEHRVAKARYRGPGNGIHGAYQSFYRDWMPESGFVPADLPPMEIYDPELGNAPEQDTFVMDICISIVPA